MDMFETENSRRSHHGIIETQPSRNDTTHKDAGRRAQSKGAAAKGAPKTSERDLHRKVREALDRELWVSQQVG